jgi:hypothetical protein
VRVGKKLLVKRAEFDRWLGQHRRSRATDALGGIVDEILSSLKE